ncbi:MAG: FKBP-type peptidyl-prolyl cis-trans isomerase, partial [Candidatus Saccharimonas sp.]|nr:FKBP-type peptidyl-prolyl cis-trans isomerase [Planctomycetaceae bacterium]
MILRRSGSTVLLTLFALLLGTEPLMLRAADKNPVEPGAVDKDAPEKFTTTKSGLKYRIRRQGKGQKPAVQDTVSVHYKGWLDNGKEFDSSYARGESIEFPLNGVIPGWTEGMQLVGKGGMIELEIPHELGYG